MAEDDFSAATARRLGLELPPGWRVQRAAGLRPFITRVRLARADGIEAEWSTRRHRKGLAPIRDHARPRPRPREIVANAAASSWRIGGLFMVGAVCFCVASLPWYFDHVDPELVAWTFFVGSIFFTSAAYLQFQEAVAAPASIDPAAPRRRGLRALVGLEPRSLGWWSTAIQLFGTVMFNISTFAATLERLTFEEQKRLIWAPDVVGSVAFLGASWLAYREVSPPRVRRIPGDDGWRIAAINLAGSIGFGFAAVGARLLATTGDPANITLVNVGTFAGGVCFFSGAALLPVESAAGRTSAATRQASV